MFLAIPFAVLAIAVIVLKFQMDKLEAQITTLKQCKRKNKINTKKNTTN